MATFTKNKNTSALVDANDTKKIYFFGPGIGHYYRLVKGERLNIHRHGIDS